MLNSLVKFSTCSSLVDTLSLVNILSYPDHTNYLYEADLAPPNFPKMGYLWKTQDDTLDIYRIQDSLWNKSSL